MSENWYKPRKWKHTHEPKDVAHVTCCLKEWQALEALTEEAKQFIAVATKDDLYFCDDLIDAIKTLDEGRKGRS